MASINYKDAEGNWHKIGVGKGVSTINGRYGNVMLTADDIGAAKTATYTVDVPANWTESGAGGFVQTVSVDGILETDNPIVDVVLGDDVEANAAYLSAWGCVTRITTADGSITLYANSSAPESGFTVQLKVVR